MRVSVIVAALAVIACAAAPVWAATPVDGLWRTQSDGGVIELHGCGDALCGRVVDSNGLRSDPDKRDEDNPDPALRDRPIRGLDILHGFKGGPTLWTNGRIYNPKGGKTYTGALKVLGPDRIRLTGCVVRPLCGSQVWRKVAE